MARDKGDKCDKLIVSADPAYPPLHWYDGKVWRGASIAITTRILADLHIPYEVRYLGPWARVMSSARDGQIDLVATLKETPERKDFLRFTHEVFSNPVAVFVPKGSRLSYAQWSDLQDFRGGIARGNRFGEPFDTFLDKYLHVEQTNNLAPSFNMLMAGRFDYVITGYYPGTTYLSSSSLEDKIYPLPTFINASPNLIGFVAASPCVAYLDSFNRRLATLLRQKIVEKSLENAINEWRKHPLLGQ